MRIDTLELLGLGPGEGPPNGGGPPPSGPETRYWFHNDHLGTPYVFTDSNKAVMWRLSADPFGEVVSELTPPQYDENLRFPGQYADRSTGLNYNWNRYYQVKIGRYYQTDPLTNQLRIAASFGEETELPSFTRFKSNLPASLSLKRYYQIDPFLESDIRQEYAYVGNNPLINIDIDAQNPLLQRLIQALDKARTAIPAVVKGLKETYKVCKNIRCKVKNQGPHHYFGWPFYKKMCHIQLNCWIKGKKGSDVTLRIPYPCKTGPSQNDPKTLDNPEKEVSQP